MCKIVGNYAWGGALQPEEVTVLVGAFDEAWRLLLKAGVKFDQTERRRRRGTGSAEASSR
jgi:hypothetical protein